MNVQKYPVGMQSFPEIRERGFVYVDKTRYIPELMDYGKYFFLGRPRRFGKSLFISTLKAFYQGRRELFEGLAVASCEHDWQPAPVLHLDFTGVNYTEDGKSLDTALVRMMEGWEREYDCPLPDVSLGIRFENIIKSAYDQTGRKVVILIDEYDKPLIDTIDRPEQQEIFRDQLRGIYGNLKKMDEYIRLAFLTGITRFGKLNIFSDLNNLNDISLMPEFSGICGITSDELREYFHPGVEVFADREGCTVEDMYDRLRRNYDGYHFSPTDSMDVYNPFSLLNSLQRRSIGQYWFSTGTPLFLAKLIKSHHISLTELSGLEVTQPEIENVPFNMEGDPVPILYQSGYLTIKAYDARTGIITLGYPNREVERGFIDQLMKVYVPASAGRTPFGVLKFLNDIEKGDAEAMMRRLRSLFASISYDSFNLLDLEQHYQNVIYLLFKLLGYYCHTEYRTATGRIDLVVSTDRYVYIFEFKIDRSAREALDQIDSKDYPLPFRADGRRIFKIGANFSSAEKNISDYIIGRE